MTPATRLARLPTLSAPDAMTALAALSDTLDTTGDRTALAALAEALPRAVAGLAPEVSVALSAVATRLVPYGAAAPVDVESLSDQPRVAWRRVQALLGHLPPAGELLTVVAGWSVDAFEAPESVLRALASAAEPAARVVCLDWLPAAVAGLGIGPSAAFDLACALATDPMWAVRAAAVGSTAFQLRLGLTHQQESRREDALLAGLDDPALEVVGAALRSCAVLGRGDWLWDFADDATRPVHLRAEALGAFGAFATAEDLPGVLALGRDVELLEAVRRCLLAAHRRGAFIGDAALPVLVEQFDRHPGWTAEALLRITHVVRDALIVHLDALPADDPRWIRRAALMGLSPAKRAAGCLSRTLRQASDPRVVAALLDAAGRSPAYRSLGEVWDRIETHPEAVLAVMRAKADAIGRELLSAYRDTPAIAPRHRRLAHDAWWAQTLDPGAGSRAARICDIAEADPASDLITEHTPRDRLTRLCRTGAARVMSDVVATFRTCVTDCVRRALAGDFAVKRIELPAIEQTIYRYGRALIAHGRAVRRWTAETPETGRDLLLQLLCDWLDEDPERAICVALLEMVARHAPDGPWLRRIEPFWRHGDREVRRAAVDAILEAGEAAAGLALSLARLVEADSPRLAARGLAAIATFEARWAEPFAIVALGRPEMAIKKAAAEALAVIASPAAAPALIDWLARHDNRGFRDALKAALNTATGRLRGALLVDAYASEADPRRRGLLMDALSGVLPLAGLLRAVASGRTGADGLVDAVVDGSLRLADAPRAQAVARLHRRQLRTPDTSFDPVDALRAHGFSPDRARAVTERWVAEADPRCLDAVRLRMAEWIAWAAEPAAAGLALAAAERQHAPLLDGLLALTSRVETAVALPFIRRCVTAPTPAQRQRAIEVVRALPDAPEPGGVVRFSTLRTLDASLTRADLTRCLAECAMGPPSRVTALLTAAFPALPTPLTDGPTRWPTLDDAARAAWLDAALRACPLDGRRLRTVPAARRRPPATIAALVERLADPATQGAALTMLLSRPAAATAWPAIRDRVLSGALVLPAQADARLAATLFDWPTDDAGQTVARRWLRHLTPAQLRHFVPTWIERRRRGDAHAEACLQATPDTILLPIVWARRAEDPTLARLITPGDGEAVRALADWLVEHAPAEAQRFNRAEVVVDAPPTVDPIAGLDAAGLQRLIEADDTAHGLAVRAVHALAMAGDAAIEPLAALAVDRRPKIRSAALRALKTVAPRARSLQATLDALRMETRRDVTLQLMRSLGHGRFAPALPALVERVVHRDPRVADAAQAALTGFGDAALAALAHAARRARPDRRARYRSVIAAIEG